MSAFSISIVDYYIEQGDLASLISVFSFQDKIMLFWIMLAVYCACLAYAPISRSNRKRDADAPEGAGAD